MPRAIEGRPWVSLAPALPRLVWRGAQPTENAERLRVFFSGNIDIVPFEEEDAIAAGDLRPALETAGSPIGPYDVLIAAQGLRSGTTLVTANVSEFACAPGLVY
jgi:tRNA(fMet)-specific endonuclease VapC